MQAHRYIGPIHILIQYFYPFTTLLLFFAAIVVNIGFEMHEFKWAR